MKEKVSLQVICGISTECVKWLKSMFYRQRRTVDVEVKITKVIFRPQSLSGKAYYSLLRQRANARNIGYVWVKSKSAHPPRQPPGIWHELSPEWEGIWHLFRSRYPGHLTPWKKTSQHLVYPNNMHQYQSRQQCKGLFPILFCNHVSSVNYTYRKQEQILKILDTMNRRSQFYNVLFKNTGSKGLHRDSQLERPLL